MVSRGRKMVPLCPWVPAVRILLSVAVSPQGERLTRREVDAFSSWRFGFVLVLSLVARELTGCRPATPNLLGSVRANMPLSGYSAVNPYKISSLLLG